MAVENLIEEYCTRIPLPPQIPYENGTDCIFFFFNKIKKVPIGHFEIKNDWLKTPYQLSRFKVLCN